MEERLTALEIKNAYLEDFLQGLQEVVITQGKLIESLRDENKAIRKKIDEISDSLEGDIPHAKPPHY